MVLLFLFLSFSGDFLRFVSLCISQPLLPPPSFQNELSLKTMIILGRQ